MDEGGVGAGEGGVGADGGLGLDGGGVGAGGLHHWGTVTA